MSTSKLRVNAEWTPHDGGQREVMAADARFRILACGRRWGKTTLAARDAVTYLGHPDALVWWVAPTYDEADRGFNAVDAALPERLIADTRKSWPKAYDTVNGARIEFRSTERENSNRGEGLDALVLDEADDIRDSAWTDDLRPSLSDTLGDMIAISTPMRKGWFYRWFQRGRSDDHSDVASWQFPTATNPHIPDSEIESARAELPQRAFEQEYLAEFKDETGGVFTNLDAALFTREYDPDKYDGDPPYRHGWDLARHEDYLVGIVLDAAGDVVHFDRARGLSWPQIQSRIEAVAADYPGTVGIDASRDNKLVADLAAGGVNIVPVKFTRERKQDLVENLAAALEAGELTAPDIGQLRHELEIFEYEVTPAGNTKYHAPEGFHDDCVDALAMANAVTARQANPDSFARSF
jgi:hypothetical protein